MNYFAQNQDRLIRNLSFQRPNSSSVPGLLATTDHPAKRHQATSLSSPAAAASRGLYDGMDGGGHSSIYSPTSLGGGPGSKLGLSMPMPNPAPEIEIAPAPEVQQQQAQQQQPAAAAYEQYQQQQQMLEAMADPNEPKKKKYAKEAWPGRKHTPSLLG